MANQIPDMIVNYGNGASITIVYDGEAYKAESINVHPEFTAKLIELSGEKWNEKMANEYVKQMTVCNYFTAIDAIRAAGKTLEEAVTLLA